MASDAEMGDATDARVEELRLQFRRDVRLAVVESFFATFAALLPKVELDIERFGALRWLKMLMLCVQPRGGPDRRQARQLRARLCGRPRRVAHQRAQDEVRRAMGSTRLIPQPWNVLAPTQARV